MHDKLLAGYADVGVRDTSVLLAVSGGADSTVLLAVSSELARRLNLRLEVACVNHGLRDESAAEQSEVGRQAEALGLPFHALNVTLAPGAALEARARELRYAALERTRKERGLAWIATAHTATDQAETLLMRLGRGAALGGAAGVLPVRGHIVRPMLRVTRDEVLAFAAARGLHFARDPMNEDRTFTRVRVRGEVLPSLRAALGPGVDEAFARFSAYAREDDVLLGELADAAWRRVQVRGDAATLDAAALRAMSRPLRRRVWARLLEATGLEVDAAVVEGMERALREGSAQTLAQGAVLRCQGGLVRVVRGGASSADQAHPTALLLRDGPPVKLSDGTTLRWRFTLLHEPPDDAGAGVIHPLVREPSGGVLEVRTRRPGDRVLLANGRSRKLQDLLVDLRIPREQRDRLWLLAEPDSARIFCVPGWWPQRGTARGGEVVVRRAAEEREAGERGAGTL